MKSGALLLFCSITTLLAQDAGTIFGIVTDSSGAVVVGAKVSLLNVDTNVSQETQSDSSGEYIFTPVRIGNYTAKVAMSGFSTAVRPGLLLNVQQRMRVDFTLAVGAIDQSVEIRAESPLLETGTSSIGQVVQNKSILELPLNGRDYQQLAVLTAGTVPTGGQSRGTADFSANGARPLNNNFLLDGVDNNSYVLDLQSFSTQAVSPSIDALQEFKVQNNNFSAEFGRYGGAVINATIKSGTNDLHGSVFEFLRNDALDANNFFNNRAGRSLPAFRQNQFGGTAGGPIVRNKLFLFGSYQGTRIAQGVTNVSTIPTQNERNGIFSVPVFDPATTRPNPSGTGSIRDQFPGNQIPSSRFDPTGKRTVDVYPAPNLSGPNNFILNPGNHTSSNQYDARFDLNLSSMDTMFGRYSLTDANGTTPGPLPAPAVGQISSARSPTTAHGAALSETHTFSPRIINDFRLGFNRLSTQRLTQVEERLIEEYGFKGLPFFSIIGGLPAVSVTGFTGIGEGGTLPNNKLSQVTQIADGVSIVHGSHTFKGGLDVRFIISNAFTPSGTRGSFAFNGTFTQDPQRRAGTGSGVADLLLGVPGTASVTTPTIGDLRQRYYGFYFQDDWQVTKNLTLNLGIRWDMSSPFWDNYDRMSNFILEPGPDFGKLVLAGSRGDSLEDRALVKFYKTDFAPRFGFAWRLPRKTVIRSSYGIFNQGTSLFGINGRLSFNPPFNQSYSYNGDQLNPTFTLARGFPDGVLQPTINQVNRGVISFDQNMHNGYMEQWNFDVQNELIPNLLIDVAYSASAGHKLTGSRNANQPRPGPGAQQPRSPFPQFTSINRVEPFANSNYQGLVAKVERRFSGGLTFLTAYTWSHFIDDTQTLLDLMGAGIQDAFNRHGEKGNANYDIRQRFVTSYAYELPVGKGKRLLNRGGPWNTALGGWQLNGIFQVQAGHTFTPTFNVNVANAGGTQRPDRISSGALPYGDRTVERWFDTKAFVSPVGFAFGNSGRNILTGPRLAQWDFSLFKSIPVTERVRLQLRIESFNFLNHPNFGLPNGSIGTTAAGTVSSTVTSPRQNQFALKLLF
ncbi:MAG TPA: TonB-dependent receptor [Bryobacteraceae bacterium]|nr:TonB-dependent receptor [Bryobacteraceae bacterium]